MSADHPYSLVMRVGDVVHVSGAAGIDYATHVAYADPREAVDACLDEVLRRLATVGCDATNIVKLVYTFDDIALRDVANAQFEARFTAPQPARTVTTAPALPYGAHVVIDCVAQAGWDRTTLGVNELTRTQEASR